MSLRVLQRTMHTAALLLLPAEAAGHILSSLRSHSVACPPVALGAQSEGRQVLLQQSPLAEHRRVS